MTARLPRDGDGALSRAAPLRPRRQGLRRLAATERRGPLTPWEQRAAFALREFLPLGQPPEAGAKLAVHVLLTLV